MLKVLIRHNANKTQLQVMRNLVTTGDNQNNLQGSHTGEIRDTLNSLTQKSPAAQAPINNTKV